MYSGRLDAAGVLLKRPVIGKSVNSVFMSRTLMFNFPRLAFSIE